MSNDIKFNRGRGGLGRALAGKDHVSAVVIAMSAASIPAELAAAGNNATLFSVQDADDLGILFSDAGNNLDLDVLRYTIDRIFDANEKAILHLGVQVVEPDAQIAAELMATQNRADGDVRQALVLAPSTDFAIGDLVGLQNACDQLEAEHKPLSVIYAPNFVGAGLMDADLRDLEHKNVSVVSAMDGNGKGWELFGAYNKTIGAGGTLLGALSSAKVHENIAWVGRFNLNDNSINEYDVLALGDGRKFKEVSVTEFDTLSAKGYIMLKKHTGKSGSYFNDSYTATSETSDYAYIENNRTIDKAVRGCREFLLPSLNAPLYVNEDGTLTEDTIASFRNDAQRALEDMQINGELSAYEVTINPDQDVLKTSKLSIAIKIVPVGVARNIVVNIGFAVRVA